MKYIKYLKYVLKHKWYVFVECYKIGEFWRGITHDLSKFLPDEFIPYARYFNGNYPSMKEKFKMNQLNIAYTGKYKEEIKKDFDKAWLKHIHRNKHHWQYWLLQEDDGKFKKLEIPFKYLIEMFCDWRGAGKAIHGYDETKEWYKENKSKIIMSEMSRKKIEYLLYNF